MFRNVEWIWILNQVQCTSLTKLKSLSSLNWSVEGLSILGYNRWAAVFECCTCGYSWYDGLGVHFKVPGAPQCIMYLMCGYSWCGHRLVMIDWWIRQREADNCEVRKWFKYTTSYSYSTSLQFMQDWSVWSVQLTQTSGPCEQCSYSTGPKRKVMRDWWTSWHWWMWSLNRTHLYHTTPFGAQRLVMIDWWIMIGNDGNYEVWLSRGGGTLHNADAPVKLNTTVGQKVDIRPC